MSRVRCLQQLVHRYPDHGTGLGRCSMDSRTRLRCHTHPIDSIDYNRCAAHSAIVVEAALFLGCTH